MKDYEIYELLQFKLSHKECLRTINTQTKVQMQIVNIKIHLFNTYHKTQNEPQNLVDQSINSQVLFV